MYSCIYIYTKISQIYIYIYIDIIYTLWVIDGFNMSTTTEVNIAITTYDCVWIPYYIQYTCIYIYTTGIFIVNIQYIHIFIHIHIFMQMLCGHNMGPRLTFSSQFFSYYMLARGMGHAPQDFAMFEPNNTCVLTIQLHFGFF